MYLPKKSGIHAEQSKEENVWESHSKYLHVKLQGTICKVSYLIVLQVQVSGLRKHVFLEPADKNISSDTDSQFARQRLRLV